jgi:glycosyltransferase involved in cell wall biosynthesis
MTETPITILTPTTGKDSLFKLIESLKRQKVDYKHILLWDDKRTDSFLYPKTSTLEINNPHMFDSYNCYSLVVPGSFVQGTAYGSALRAIGLMLATTPYVTFADDDCWYDSNHLQNLLQAISKNDANWAYCRRKIWANENECIGVDDFESVGDSKDRKVPYEMVDNNCMIFKRRLGTSGAVLYRETMDYNDDRLFYDFLKQYAGVPNVTTIPTINQICPLRLEQMFRKNCTKI